jgi:hypothetical protein
MSKKMPETDQDIHDFNEEERKWKAELDKKYSECISIITTEDFLEKDGRELLNALAEYRRVAVVPPTPREMVPDSVEEGGSQGLGLLGGQQQAISTSKVSFSLIGGILAGIAILGLVFFSIYKLLNVGSAVVGIFGTLIIFAVAQNPRLLHFLSSKLESGEQGYSEKVDSIFEEIITDLEKAVYVSRDVPPQFTDKTTKKMGAYHDELYKNPVTQAMLHAASEYTNKIGIIQAAAERELYRRRRLLIKITGEVSGAASAQSIRPQIKS